VGKKIGETVALTVGGRLQPTGGGGHEVKPLISMLDMGFSADRSGWPLALACCRALPHRPIACDTTRGWALTCGSNGVNEEKPVGVSLLSACGLSMNQHWG
jgi:hypothetical protein